MKNQIYFTSGKFVDHAVKTCLTPDWSERKLWKHINSLYHDGNLCARIIPFNYRGKVYMAKISLADTTKRNRCGEPRIIYQRTIFQKPV